MAYSKTTLFTSVFGDKRVVSLAITADAASGAVDTGLSKIQAIGGVVALSAATAGAQFTINANSGTTASNGSLLIKSAANGDVFHVTVYGV